MNETLQQPETPSSSTRKTPWIGILLGFVALAIGLYVGWVAIQFFTGQKVLPFGAPPQMHGLVLQSPEKMPNFTLPVHTGGEMAISDFEGKLVMLYYGYTYCPDVCPSTLAEISNALDDLGKDADQVQVIMVTVDPERDTLDKIGEYVTYFHPSFIGMVPDSEEALISATSAYGIFYERHEGTVESGYLIDHSAGVLLLDQEGFLKVLYPYGVSGEDIAQDLQYFLR